ncbi:MAG: amidase, partial [Hyphomicrobiales bacterium]
MSAHRLDPDLENVHWGFFDANLKAALTIPNGGRVTISTVSGGRESMPPPPFVIPPQLTAIHAQMTPTIQGHICTGPVAVEGARKGQALQVDIEAIEPFYDWGYQVVRPLAGALPDDF